MFNKTNDKKRASNDLSNKENWLNLKNHKDINERNLKLLFLELPF